MKRLVIYKNKEYPGIEYSDGYKIFSSKQVDKLWSQDANGMFSKCISSNECKAYNILYYAIKKNEKIIVVGANENLIKVLALDAGSYSNSFREQILKGKKGREVSLECPYELFDSIEEERVLVDLPSSIIVKSYSVKAGIKQRNKFL